MEENKLKKEFNNFIKGKPCPGSKIRSKGLGKLLLKSTMKAANLEKGIRTMSLGTNPKTRAYSLYKRNKWYTYKQYLKYSLKLQSPNGTE